MRHRKLVGLSVLAIVLASAQPAYGASNLVDGSITSGDTVCSWTGAATSDNPPNTLTIDQATINPPGGNLSCADDTVARLDNSPVATFDDAAGTGTANAVDVTVTVIGVQCSYRVSGPVLNRQGDTRDYAGGPYTANKTAGSFLCPGTRTIDQATLSFH